jgi:hypothetical protein
MKKTEGLVTSMDYLGLTIDTESYFHINKSSYISFVTLIKWCCFLAVAVAKYRRLLNARPAGNVRVQKAKLSHNDYGNSFIFDNWISNCDL